MWCWSDRPKKKTRVRSSEGGGVNPFPILRTLCTKRGLVRISRKDNKSVIFCLERRTKRPEPRGTPGPVGRGILIAPSSCPSYSRVLSRRARGRRRSCRLVDKSEPRRYLVPTY